MNILEQIYQDKLIEVRAKKKQRSGQELCRLIKESNLPRFDFIGSLQKAANKNYAVIAEIKKASPSRGLIRADFDAVEIARIYEKSGAAAISILTDEKYFQGKNEYLTAVKQNVKLPILRKDFILDPYQIWEARLIGADCILLIMAMLDLKKAQELEAEAHKIGLAVLAEVHDEKELAMALQLKTPLIGINNRNLKTLAVDLNNSLQLSKLIPSDRMVICESGIVNNYDTKKMQAAGINIFLIGESLMKQSNISVAFHDIFPELKN